MENFHVTVCGKLLRIENNRFPTSVEIGLWNFFCKTLCTKPKILSRPFREQTRMPKKSNPRSHPSPAPSKRAKSRALADEEKRETTTEDDENGDELEDAGSTDQIIIK